MVTELLSLTAQISAMFAGLQFAFYALAPSLIPKYFPPTEGERSEVIRKINKGKFIKKFRIKWGFYSSFFSFILFILSMCLSLYLLLEKNPNKNVSYLLFASFIGGLVFFFISVVIILRSILGVYKIPKYSDHVKEAISCFGYNPITHETIDGLSFHFDVEFLKAYIDDLERNLLFLIENREIEKIIDKMESILQEAIRCYEETRTQIALLHEELSKAQNASKKKYLNEKIEEKSEEQDYYRNPRIIISRELQFSKEEIERIEMEKDTICLRTKIEVHLYFWDESSLTNEIAQFPDYLK